MKIVELAKVPVEGHRFRTLLSRPGLCAEIVAAIAEAAQATREQMHPQLSPSVKGMHAYGHAMTNLGYATEGYGGRLKVVQGQQRIVFPQTEGLGELHVALAKGVPSAGGFDVGLKGAATDGLINIWQGTFDYDLPGIPMDDGAFFVHMLVADPDDEDGLDAVVYLAHPARMDARRTFLYCDECVLLGRRSLRRGPAVDQPTLIDVVPSVGARRR